MLRSVKSILVSLMLAGWQLLPALEASARPSPVGTAFTYQGQLNQGGEPVTGTADFQFSLFDEAAGGNQVGTTQAHNAITVTNGGFTLDLDFGAGVFGSDARWLQIAVRSPAGSGTFTTLSPRQRIHAVPVSQFALGGAGVFSGTFSGTVSGDGANLTNLNAASMTGVIPSSALSGTYSGAVTFSNPGNSFQGLFNGTHSGNGAALNSLDASNVSSGTLSESRLPASLLDRVPNAVVSGTEIASVAGIGGGLTGIAVSGNRAFIVGSAGLRIFDISNPESPALISTTAAANGNKVAVAGNFAYVIREMGVPNPGQLKIVDCTNVSSPVVTATTNTGVTPFGIVAVANLVYVVNADSSSMQIFNVSNPASPTLAGSANVGSVPDGIDVQGSFAYIVNFDGGLKIYNVSNPASPTLTGSIATGPFPMGIAVANNRAYVATDLPLLVFDVANPATPTLLGSLNALQTFTFSVKISGDYFYAARPNDLRIINVANPAAMFVAQTTPFTNMLSVDVAGDFAYGVSGQSVFKVFKSSALENETPMGAVNFLDGSTQSTAFATNFSGVLSFTNASNTFAGSGAGLTQLNASNMSTGTVADARLSSNVATLTGTQTFTGNKSFTGNVGIGTTNLVQRLNVVGANQAAASTGTSADAIARFQPTGSSATLDIGYLSSPAHAWIQSRDASNYANDFNLVLNPNGGNVGIGTTTPAAALDVSGGLRVNGGEGAYISDGATARTWIGSASNANFIQSGNLAWTESRVLNFTGFNASPGTFAFNGNVGIVGDLNFDVANEVVRKIRNAHDLHFSTDSDGDSPGWFRVFESADAFEQLRIVDGNEASILGDGTFTSNGIDYAEGFKALQSDLEPGDVVSLAVGQWEYCSRTSGEFDQHMIGVVSTQPAFLCGMSFDAEEEVDPALHQARNLARQNEDFETEKELTQRLAEKVRQVYRPIALAGRVPCKVDASFGAIRAGDRLTSSSTLGHAMRQTRSGPSIGIALQDLSEGKGMVMTLVQPGWFDAIDQRETEIAQLRAANADQQQVIEELLRRVEILEKER